MPDWTPSLRARLAALSLTPAREREIVDELSQHLDDLYGERRAAGATHQDAMRLALEEIDDGDLLARGMRPLRQASAPPSIAPGAPGRGWFADLGQDIRYAVRTLRQARGWTLVVLFLLALGIGANATIFSAADALLISPLAVSDPHALVRLRWTGKNDGMTEYDGYGFERPTTDGQSGRSSFSYAIFRELAADARGAAELFACVPLSEVDVVVDGRAELAEGFGVSGNYFSVLGVVPLRGRLLGPNDEEAGASPVAVISAKFWHARFGGDPSIVGRTIRASNLPVTIIGVTPAGFTGVQQPLGDPPDITFPLALDRQMRASSGGAEGSFLDQPTAWWLNVMGRLGPGTTSERLHSMLAAPFQQTARANYDGYLRSLTEEERAQHQRQSEMPRLVLESGARGVYDVDDGAVTSARILSAVVAIVLLIICANVANLMLSRAIVRHKEISIRLSLGATRARLMRQLLTESLLLGVGGGALGLLVASWGLRLLPPPASNAGVLHWHTLGFTALASIVTSLLFGLAPALRGTGVNITGALKDTSRTIAGRGGVLSRGLLAVQVTLSLVLLVGAGLFLQTVGNLRRVNVGFNPDNLLLIRFMPRLSGYDQPRTTQLYKTLIDTLATIPGVRGAALAQPALLTGNVSSTDIFIQGRTYPANQDSTTDTSINRLVISPSFFDVAGIPILLGRPLSDRDDKGAPRVALINEAAVRAFFPGENPLGRRFGSRPNDPQPIEIVGVVKDAKYSDLREAPPPTMYVTYTQAPRAVAVIELRTATAPSAVVGAVRDAVHAIDPALPLAMVSTQADQIERRMKQEKMFAQAYAVFGGVALLLASVGLFGLMSYNVARRTGEMGVRMALGAQRRDVMGLVMRESMVLVAIGLAAGLAIAVATGRFLSALLFGLPSKDPVTMTIAVAVMTTVCALAAYLPARRASRVDPMTALRHE